MLEFKYGLLITNIILAFFLLSADSGLALVNMAAAFGLALSIYFTEDY